jgi:hypothetical protein
LKKIIFAQILIAAFAGATATAFAQDSESTKPAVGANPHGTMSTKPGAAMPPGHGGTGSIPASTQLVNSGKVLDVLDTDMYTYLQVTSNKGPVWIAAYKTEVAKGANVKFSNGVMMSKFTSKSLNRTFDQIVFIDTLKVVK